MGCQHGYGVPLIVLKLKTLFCCTVIFSGPTQVKDSLIPEPPRADFQDVVTVY